MAYVSDLNEFLFFDCFISNGSAPSFSKVKRTFGKCFARNIDNSFDL